MPKKHTSYHINNIKVPGVTTILGVIHKPAIDAWQRRMGQYKADKLLQQAAQFGTSVHEGIENYILGVEAEYETTRVQQAIESFKDWSESNVKRWICIEKAVWHDTLMYAGTLDALAELLTGEIVMIDFKTSKSIHASYDLQVCAYVRATRIEDNVPEFNDIKTALIVHLDHKTMLWGAQEADISDESWEVFNHVLAVYKWREKCDK